jgi:hypothetical protein
MIVRVILHSVRISLTEWSYFIENYFLLLFLSCFIGTNVIYKLFSSLIVR